MAEDLYAVLGVSKTATQAEIKKAFREKSKSHHPDKGGDETTFKKISAAYDVLSDDGKRAQYDQFGSTMPGGSGGTRGGFSGGFSSADFGGFEDVFSSFFGGGRSSGRKSSAQQGADLEVDVELSFEDSIRGLKKSFSSKNLETCEKCKGEGGFDKKNCARCNGTGSISQSFQTPFGQMTQQASCPNCRRQGYSFEKRCSDCQGEGRIRKKKDIEVIIPAGVDSGEVLRLRGKGEAGIRGGGCW